jgi:membrane associated rhomboid family serine protease
VSATAKLPVITLGLIGVAGLVSASAELAAGLVWDRQAIGDGQWWRLLTGHLVHFTPRHLLCDVLAVGVAGWLIESRRISLGRPRCVVAASGKRTRQSAPLHRTSPMKRDATLAFVILAAALTVSGTLALLCPAVRFYGGLSGIAWAMGGYLAVRGVMAGGRARWLGVAALAALAGKLAWEWASGGALLAGEGYVVLPAVHAAGAVCGMLKGATAT